MSTGRPTPIPWPTSSFPGANSQEGGGRLINCYVEKLGEASASRLVWRRSPGLSQHAATSNSGYRGGLIVNNLSYECWENDASTVDASGNVTDIGNFPGTNKISIARNQASPTPDVIAVDIDNGAYVLESAGVTSATGKATIGPGYVTSSAATINGSFSSGDTASLTFTNSSISVFPVTVSYTLGGSDNAATVALALATYINSNAHLAAGGITATNDAGIITINQSGTFSANTTVSESTSGGLTITLAPTSGVMGYYIPGQTVTLTFENEYLDELVNNTITASYTIASGDTATSIATGLAAAINANSTLAGLDITATSSGAVVTISHLGSIGNSTQILATIPQSGSLAVTFNPSSGNLSGGTGTPGAFTGTPTLFNGQGNLPEPNSICFQDGYFFFTTASGQVYATPLNSLTMNALTYITVQAKSDVELLRGIAFSGLLFLFTTGSCEVWQDVANPAPAFPYGRLGVLEYGLIQSAAIAGWETGFSQLLWVAQDFGVYWMQPGSLAPIKASPPDLDRLIEAEVRAGNTLEAGCYIFSGRKFWQISSPDWTWEFNIGEQKWSERQSLATTGSYGRWRGTGGHPAFGKWLVGDEQTGNLLWIDSANYTENSAPQLFRLESGPVKDFPNQIGIARADFDFVMGVGIIVGNFTMTVLGAASGTNGVVRLTVDSTSRAQTNDICNVANVTGTTEANGTWPVTVIDATHIELQGSVFANAYVSGGTAVDLTSPSNAVQPTAAISCSKDGGFDWGYPLVRQIGQQGQSKHARASVKNMGLSGTMGVRWRIDITDPVYAAFLGGTQSSDPRLVGA